jgi:uncharacterized oxidoreductase
VKTAGLRVIVTGGGSGIGLAIARRLAQANTVAIVGRDPVKLREAQRQDPALRAQVLDVSNEASASAGVTSVGAELGGIDMLVNAAGMVVGFDPVGPNSAALAERDMQVNFLGSLRMVRLCLPYLQESTQGAVVLISSAMAIAPAPGFAVYSASKAAVHSLARSLRRELRSLKVYEVQPTWVDTGPTRDMNISKLDARVVAEKLIVGLAADRDEIGVGQTGAVRFASRLSNRLAEALVARATRG